MVGGEPSSDPDMALFRESTMPATVTPSMFPDPGIAMRVGEPKSGIAIRDPQFHSAFWSFRLPTSDFRLSRAPVRPARQARQAALRLEQRQLGQHLARRPAEAV